jgi:hypothetical protein
LERAKSSWSTRVVASTWIAAVVVLVSVAASIAAPPGPSATADQDGASSTALGVPGTVTVSESNAHHDAPPTWSAVKVADTTVIGKDETGWSGEAADLGPTIDSLNVALCPAPVALDPTTNLSACANLLPSYAAAATDDGMSHSEAGGSILQVGAALVSDDSTLLGGGVDLLPSQAAESGPDCPLSSSVAGLLTIALGTGGTDIQRMTLGLEEALVGGCVG